MEGAVFEDFTLPYLPALDAGVSIVLGFCAGVAQGPRIPRTTCIITLSTALLAASAHFFVFVYYRPCLVRMTQVFMSVASGLTLASVGLSFAFYMGQQFEYNSAVEKIMLSQSLLGVLLMVLGVGFTALVFIDFVDAFLAGKDLKHLEKVTKEQIDQYRKDELQKEQDRQAALLKQSKKNKKSRQQSELEEEFSILVAEMKPLDGEEDLSMLNLKKEQIRRTSSNDVNHDNDDQELELVLSPSENQENNNHHRQRELSYHDYLHRSNNSSSSSSNNSDDEDQDMDSFFRQKRSPHQQRNKGNKKKRKNNAILSQSDRHVIAKNITETSAMIRSVLESEQQQQQDLSRPDHNKSSTEEKSSVVNTIPQFRNSALTSQQSRRMKELLEQADEKKRKAEEEKIERALKEHEARERAQRQYEEERKRRQEQQQQQRFLDDDEDDDEEAMRELDEILL